MICPACHGGGKNFENVTIDEKFTYIAQGLPVPCSECDGSGFLHCCDGLTAVNDPPDDITSK